MLIAMVTAVRNLQKVASDLNYTQEVLIVAAFLNQTFGITNVPELKRERVLLFIFGGTKARMQAEHYDKQEAYLAYIMSVICTELYCTERGALKRWLKRLVAVASFHHIDMQHLVLEEA